MEVFFTEQVGSVALESKINNHLILSGEFGIIDTPTQNRRIYPEDEVKKEIKRLSALAEQRKLFGELDHPDTIRKVRLERVSHMILSLWIKDKKIWGKLLVLKTPMGQIVEKICEAGGVVGISLRGKGVFYQRGEYWEVRDLYIETFDIVTDPGDPDAYLYKEGTFESALEQANLVIDLVSEQSEKSLAVGYTTEHIIKEIADSIYSHFDEYLDFLLNKFTRLSEEAKSELNKLNSIIKRKNITAKKQEELMHKINVLSAGLPKINNAILKIQNIKHQLHNVSLTTLLHSKIKRYIEDKINNLNIPGKVLSEDEILSLFKPEEESQFLNLLNSIRDSVKK